MLVWKSPHKTYKMHLEGRDVKVFRLHAKEGGMLVAEPLGSLAKWSFESHEVEVHFDGMPPELIEVANAVFGTQLRKLEPKRQGGLFPGSCCVCGAAQDTFPETLQHDEHGNVFSVASPEPLRWRCNVCNRLVCRKCTLVAPSGRYYHHTYCSEACRAANPDGWDSEDDWHD